MQARRQRSRTEYSWDAVRMPGSAERRPLGNIRLLFQEAGLKLTVYHMEPASYQSPPSFLSSSGRPQIFSVASSEGVGQPESGML